MSGIISQNVGRPSGLVKAAEGGGGTWTLIKTLTASADSDLSFVDGTDDVVLDSTYPIYVLKFINIHAGTHDANFTAGFRDGGSAYDATKTTSTFYAYHNEADDVTGLSYAGHDMAQGTGFCQIGGDAMGTDNDQGCSGTMFLFNPSSTTFVKHFMVTMNTLTEADYDVNEYTAGYCNTTSAIDAVDFKFTSGNIDAGKIKLYGIGDS
jgi:hypothetical protein